MQPAEYPGEPQHQPPTSAPPWQPGGYPEQYAPQPFPQPPIDQYQQEPYQQDAFPQRPVDPYAQGGYGVPGPPFAPDRQRRGHGLMIFILVLVLVVLLGGGTALFLFFGRSQGTGESNPSLAVDRFLTAVFRDRDVTAAEEATCRSARNTNSIRQRINELREFDLRYKAPKYTWPNPTIETQHPKSATVSVTMKLTTSDDRISEQRMRFLTIKDDGWLVCEISTA